ncbi:MAG: hypothetical protein ACKO2P_19840 [Planctomycetota bacterium]
MIGSSVSAWPLLQELHSEPGAALAGCAISGPLLDLAAGRIPLRFMATPEDALMQQQLDVVVLALDDMEEILRLAQVAVQAEQHVVVVVPVLGVSPSLLFDLQLIADESRAAVIPIADRWLLTDLPPASLDLALPASDVRQLLLELNFDAESEESLARATRTGLDVLSASGFRYSQVTCLDSAAPGGILLSRLITLGTQPEAELPLPPATLTLRPGASAGATLRALLSTGEVREFSLGTAESQQVLPRIRWFCEDLSRCQPWLDRCSETLELAEAATKSLRRRRTVDVHFDAGTERSVFKSLMTAMGCGVLTWLLFSMVALLIVGQLLDLPDWFWQTARILWFTPVLLFLVAQFLLPLARDRSGPPRGPR